MEHDTDACVCYVYGMSNTSQLTGGTYPQADWPYTFYFNGVQMPKWTAQWHLCGLQGLLNDYTDDWDEFIGYKHLRYLEIWLHQIGVIRSEDPLIFRVCAQEMLSLLLGRPDEVLKNIQAAAPLGLSAPEILNGLTEGIAQMLALCEREGRAVWISGYPADQEFRLASMLSRLDPDPPRPSLELPHVIQRREELLNRSRTQLKNLRMLASRGRLNKRQRQIILQLPAPGGRIR